MENYISDLIVSSESRPCKIGPALLSSRLAETSVQIFSRLSFQKLLSSYFLPILPSGCLERPKLKLFYNFLTKISYNACSVCNFDF